MSNVEFEDKMKQFEGLCRSAGLKVTPQRLAVYRILAQSREHPSADMVHKQLHEQYPNISLDTVNRTLLTLNEIGAAFVIEGTGEVRRYDAGMHPHQHFKCVKCKRIIDFHCQEYDEMPVPACLSDIYEVHRRTVYFEGFCDKCK